MGAKPRSPNISRRKQAHIAIAASGNARFTKKKSLLGEVDLVHQALPELNVQDIDLSTDLLGKTLQLPLVFSGMTGGTPAALAINRDLAKVAQEYGIAMGVGSQRAMVKNANTTRTYQVRTWAPDILLLGNIGIVQAKEMGVHATIELAKMLELDALAVHLNPAQEMIQQNGDRDFTGGLRTLAALREKAPFPIVAKETGCGISPKVAANLVRIGVETVDVSGAGGTSWTAVESLRAPKGSLEKRVGETFWNWGIPTAASVAVCANKGLAVIATGGLQGGLDVARAIALGARVGGIAGAALKAQQDGGTEELSKFVEQAAQEIRIACLLTGSSTVDKLSKAQRIIGPTLTRWLDGFGVG